MTGWCHRPYLGTVSIEIAVQWGYFRSIARAPLDFLTFPNRGSSGEGGQRLRPRHTAAITLIAKATQP
jgi:hypothetical protein